MIACAYGGTEREERERKERGKARCKLIQIRYWGFPSPALGLRTSTSRPLRERQPYSLAGPRQLRSIHLVHVDAVKFHNLVLTVGAWCCT